MADRYPCHACKKNVSKTRNDRYRTHTDGDGEPCEQSSDLIPQHILEAGPVDPKAPADVPVEGVDYAQCPQCTRKVQLTRLGYFEPHDETLRGGERCAVSGVRYEHARRAVDVPLPDDEKPKPGAERLKVRDSETISPAPGSTSAGAGSTRTAPPQTDGSEIDWSDVQAERIASLPDGTLKLKGEPWLDPTPIDWSKVGDLKHLPGEKEAEFKAEVDRARRDYSLIPDRQSAPPAASSASTESNSPESPSTSTLSLSDTTPTESTSSGAPGRTESAPAAAEVFSLGVTVSDRFLQPASPFLQPAAWTPPVPVFLQPPEYEGPVKGEPMGELAKELATRIKETFYAYSNRKTSDNRSAQTTLGPSEIGTPCDRRLAMALMGVPAVNPGGDGWAAFVGTWTHQGMAEVYTFADAGTGRYAVELPVFLGTPTVPRGTTDLLDRRDGVVTDWKVMGSYSLKKFKAEGPSDTYRTQAHVYGLGAERAGEKVRNVAIVGLPRAGRSLDEMHVWTEKFDRKFAQAALDRVEKIANDIQSKRDDTGALAPDTPADIMYLAKQFPAADDCTYCPFYLKGDKEMTRGCPGR